MGGRNSRGRNCQRRPPTPPHHQGDVCTLRQRGVVDPYAYTDEGQAFVIAMDSISSRSVGSRRSRRCKRACVYCISYFYFCALYEYFYFCIRSSRFHHAPFQVSLHRFISLSFYSVHLTHQKKIPSVERCRKSIEETSRVGPSRSTGASTIPVDDLMNLFSQQQPPPVNTQAAGAVTTAVQTDLAPRHAYTTERPLGTVNVQPVYSSAGWSFPSSMPSRPSSSAPTQTVPAITLT